MNKNYIELNGKRYDAVTGALLGAAPSQSLSSKTHTKSMSKSRLITDMAPVRSKALAPVITPKPVRKTRSHHGGPKVAAARKPQTTATLMRHVVAKPKIATKPAVKHAYPIKKQPSEITVHPKHSVHKVDATRLHRAGQVNRSPHIGRFEAKSIAPIRPKIRPLQVKAAPVAAGTSMRPLASHHTKPATMREKKARMFEQALESARSHEEPAHKPIKKSRVKRNQRAISTFAALAAIFIVGGFVVYLNKGSVELQVASARAGFQANMPSYKPAGFTQQSTDAKDGKVAINFVSPSTGGGFTLTQQSSDWNSQTLFDTLVANSDSYKAVQRNGSTIYIYDGDKAAWVDGGILYQVVSKADLSSSEIVSLAASM